MSKEKPEAVPIPFLGTRVLLVDNDTESLLGTASKLEDYSYRVTTTELAAVALSILRERKDHFDLVMADTNMLEIDLFRFIKRVQLIKDVPIILMSVESDKDMIEEAMMKGACFFLQKPISSKNLKNLWQHVYRKNKNKNIRGGNGKEDNKSNVDHEAESSGTKEEDGKVQEVVYESTLQDPEGEQVGDSDQIENDADNTVGGKRPTELTGICMKMSTSTQNNDRREYKTRREDDGNERTRSTSNNSEARQPFAGNKREMENRENKILKRKSC